MNYFIKKNIPAIALVCFLIFLASISFTQSNKVSGQASLTGDLCGFAWTATDEGAGGVPSNPRFGLGWVSFNKIDCDPQNGNLPPGCTAGSSNYKVSVNSSGNMNGYAWIGSRDTSSPIGWVKFGGLSGFPPGAGTTAANAKIGSNGTVTGWARACTVFQSGCSGPLKNNLDRGGWDGWISLRGNAGNGGSYGVNLNTQNKTFSGFAWGGDVVGWLSFKPSNNSGVRYCGSGPSVFSVFLEANPNSGPAPLTSVLTADASLIVSHGKIKNNWIERLFAQGAVTYQFDCEGNDTYSAAQSSNTFNCTYPLEGVYVAWVKATQGEYTGEGSVTINVTDENGTEPPPPPPQVTCSIDSDPPFYVNRPLTWSAVVPENYSYTWNFGSGFNCVDGDGCQFNTPSPSISYSTIGQKAISLTATPPLGEGSQVTVSCGSINVLVRPNIIEN